MKPCEIFEQEIIDFLKGKTYFGTSSKGHVWVSEHTISRPANDNAKLCRERPLRIINDHGKGLKMLRFSIDVLTVEPTAGGQYEIAIRFPLVDGHHPGHDEDKYSGYRIVGNHILGKNTHGH